MEGRVWYNSGDRFECSTVLVIVLLNVGGFFSRLFSGLWGTKEMRILILGLDGAGKTTILYRLQVGEVVTTIPSKSRIKMLPSSLQLKTIRYHSNTDPALEWDKWYHIHQRI